MKELKFSFKDIVHLLQAYYQGQDIQQVCLESNISREQFDTYIRELGEIASEMVNLKDENQRLRNMFLDVSLDNQSLKNAISQSANRDSSLLKLLLAKEEG
ncbi:hypothetical protein [Pedobacter aquatilis]|uniref:hypothetical protein n=1 Tax=Pedobacter aquatilis TaxID=351343 RepID=UPI0029318A84|nr:hypothetical protein [Pedobacter aquatilis]